MVATLCVGASRVMIVVIGFMCFGVQLADVGCAVYVCSELHQRYDEFSSHLLDHLQKIYSTGIGKDEDKVSSWSCVFISVINYTLYTVCSDLQVQNWIATFG